MMARGRKRHKKKKVKKTRNWHALNAILRHAGPIKDKRKEASKRKCRNKNEKTRDE